MSEFVCVGKGTDDEGCGNSRRREPPSGFNCTKCGGEFKPVEEVEADA